MSIFCSKVKKGQNRHVRGLNGNFVISGKSARAGSAGIILRSELAALSCRFCRAVSRFTEASSFLINFGYLKPYLGMTSIYMEAWADKKGTEDQ